MKTKPIEIISKLDGSKVPADLLVCPECGGEFFGIFIIGNKHQHLQCQICETTFCDQGCALVGREN